MQGEEAGGAVWVGLEVCAPRVSAAGRRKGGPSLQALPTCGLLLTASQAKVNESLYTFDPTEPLLAALESAGLRGEREVAHAAWCGDPAGSSPSVRGHKTRPTPFHGREGDP